MNEHPEKIPSRPGLAFMAALLLVLLTAFAYRNTLDAPFVFDDKVNVLDNPSILSLDPIQDAFWAPEGKGTAGRPLVNFSYAVNYAGGRLAPAGWHAVNIAIHITAVLALFGLLLRSFTGERLGPWTGRHALVLAFACASLWAVHPVLTESVSYITQRAESLMGALYLLSLYCAVRAFSGRASLFWQALAVVFFILGVGAKEVIVTAPLLAFLYDLVINRRRPRKSLLGFPLLYGGYLAGLVLLFLLVRHGGSASSDPLDLAMPWYQYALLQPAIILHYLRLSLWPDALCFDYLGWRTELQLADAAAGVLVLALVVWGLLLCLRRRPAGYLFAWFFLILAPTSSIMPLKCLAYEHRMYLSLISVIVLLVLGVHYLILRFTKEPGKRKAAFAAALTVWVLVLGALFLITLSRNEQYRSAITLWSDTLEKMPANHRAHVNLAQAYCNADQPEKCAEHYRAALAMDPDYGRAHYNLANTLERLGENAESERHYLLAINYEPSLVEARVNYASLLTKTGRDEEAEEALQRAFAFAPDYAPAHYNLATLLAEKGRWASAAGHYEKVLRQFPGLTSARLNLGICYGRLGRSQDAVRMLAPLVRDKSAPYPAVRALARSYETLNNRAAASSWYRSAAAVAPSPGTALALLGRSFFLAGKPEAAREQVEKALALEPENQEAQQAKELLESGAAERQAASG